MDTLRIIRVKSRVSLVVALRDGYASGAPFDRDIEVRLADYPRKPIAKPDGTYIFIDLEPGTYRLNITSAYYFRETRDISVGGSNAIVHIPLMPLPSYPYGANATLIRAMVARAPGVPLGAAVVTAAVLSEDGARGRLSEDKTAKGSDEITVASLTGPVEIGDMFVLAGRGPKGGREPIRVGAVLERQKRFRLEAGLSAAYTRGSLLLPLYMSRTTGRGELAVAFPGMRAKSFRTELRLEGEAGEAIASQQLSVEDGGTVNLGTWTV